MQGTLLRHRKETLPFTRELVNAILNNAQPNTQEDEYFNRYTMKSTNADRCTATRKTRRLKKEITGILLKDLKYRKMLKNVRRAQKSNSAAFPR